MNSLPQFKIHGLERRLLKKELSLLKFYLKGFWYNHQLEKDMASFYGSTGNYPMKDDDAKKHYNQRLEKINYLETILKEKYESNILDNDTTNLN